MSTQPASVDKREFLPAGEFAVWIGPFPEQDTHGRLTGEFFVECPDCGRIGLVEERKWLKHGEDCELAEVLSR